MLVPTHSAELPTLRNATDSARIISVQGVLPRHCYRQIEITEAVCGWSRAGASWEQQLRRLHANTGVHSRYLALPLERYGTLPGFGAANDNFLSVALDLGEQAVSSALAAAGLSGLDVDLIVTVSTTGIAAPSIDARLTGALGLRTDVKRMPMFGLGCVAGAAGIARVNDYLVSRPDQIAVLLSVELCSLTFQNADTSVAAMIGSGLFADGAAAVVIAGWQRAADLAEDGPRILATSSRTYPGTQDVMGWRIRDTGFELVLNGGLPKIVGDHIGADVDTFLHGQGLERSDIGQWVCHPGGPKVLHALENALGLPADATALTWQSLERIGNISSSSVLHVLRDTNTTRPPEGTLGLLMAIGPGLSAELVLLTW